MRRNWVRLMIVSGLVGPAIAHGPRPAEAGLVVTAPHNRKLDFGNVLVGSTAAGDATARNTGLGAATLTFGPATATPPFARAGSSTAADVPKNGTATRTYSFAPTVRGSATTTADITSSKGESVTVTLSGRGVAPVNAVSATDAGLTRIGTQGTATVTVRNVGDGNTTAAGAAVGNLAGAVRAATGSSNFTGPSGASLNLGDGQSQSSQYIYTPTTHAADAATVAVRLTDGSADGRNQAETVSVTIAGRGVGPDLQASSAPDSSLDFGTVDAGLDSHLAFQLTNATTDPNGGLAALTGLTLLDATITGPDAVDFSIAGLTPGMVLDAGSASIFDLVFHAGPPSGLQSATLTLFTDQGAAFGAAGQVFRFGLTGTTAAGLVPAAVPEPSTLVTGSLAALAGLGYALRRRRAAAS